MNTEDAKLLMFLDLFDAGYKNAYVSVMDFQSRQNNHYNRIEIVLPNVGRLRLYQTFKEILDEQFPCICVFYSMANTQNAITKIKNPILLNRATRIIYNCQKYFESHPEYSVDMSDIVKTAQFNQKMIDKQYYKYQKQQQCILHSFVKSK